MNFERLEENPNLARVRFDETERKLVYKGLFHLAINAAIKGNKQYDLHDPEMVLIWSFLKIDKINSKGDIKGVNSAHLNVLADSIEVTNLDAPLKQVKEIGGFIYELRAAAKVLDNSLAETSPSQQEIDKIVQNIEIPNSPEDL